MNEAAVYKNGDVNKGKDVSLNPWVLDTGDDRIPVWVYLSAG